MPMQLQVLVISISLVVLVGVVHFLITRHLREQDSILWFVIVGVCVILAVFPRFLTYLAHFFGIDYPPTLLFLVATLLLIAVSFRNSLEISRLKEENRELISQLSLLKSEQDAGKKSGDTATESQQHAME